MKRRPSAAERQENRLRLLEARGDRVAGAADLTAHEAAANPHPGYRLPVGSVFLTIGNTNPDALLGYGTWTLRASGLALVGA